MVFMLLLPIFVDAVLWGTTGYVLFRRFGGRDERWWVGVMATLLAVLAFDLATAEFWAGLTDDTQTKDAVRGYYTSWFVAERVVPVALGFKMAQRGLRGLSFLRGKS
jgi:hypothetical protein